MAEQTAELALIDEINSEHVELTDSQKIDYMFAKFTELESLIEAAGPLLEQAGPLLAQFGGQASSPLGRIAGSLFR
jgi:hypothetical protein